MDEIPSNLIINFGTNYVLVSFWTMETVGAKHVEVAGKDDKQQITPIFAGSMTGN